MSFTRVYREQHKDLLHRLKVIIEQTEPGHNWDFTLLLEQITLLSSLIHVHLMLEDEFLYPLVEQSNQEAIRKIAEQSRETMLPVCRLINTYFQRWKNPHRILRLSQEFRQETLNLHSVLTERFKKETYTLYPLADSLSARNLIMMQSNHDRNGINV